MNPDAAADIPDYHTHNELCKHASGRTADYAKAAIAKGVKEFAATDHCPTDCGFGVDHRMQLDEFPLYAQDVSEAQKSFPEVIILLGLEADYYAGCEGFLKPFLDAAPFDVILGSVHFRDYWSTNPVKRGLADGDKPANVWQEYFGLIGRLAETRLYDIVTHLDLPKRFGNGIDEESFKRYALPALDRIASAGMAIEINTSGNIHSVREMYPSLHLLSWAAERGIGLSFGSDAHKPDRIADDFLQAIALAKEAGYKEGRRFRKRAWSTYPLP